MAATRAGVPTERGSTCRPGPAGVVQPSGRLPLLSGFWREPLLADRVAEDPVQDAAAPGEVFGGGGLAVKVDGQGVEDVADHRGVFEGAHRAGGPAPSRPCPRLVPSSSPRGSPWLSSFAAPAAGRPARGARQVPDDDGDDPVEGLEDGYAGLGRGLGPGRGGELLRARRRRCPGACAASTGQPGLDVERLALPGRVDQGGAEGLGERHGDERDAELPSGHGPPDAVGRLCVPSGSGSSRGGSRSEVVTRCPWSGRRAIRRASCAGSGQCPAGERFAAGGCCRVARHRSKVRREIFSSVQRV